jgi:hypothetical protein
MSVQVLFTYFIGAYSNEPPYDSRRNASEVVSMVGLEQGVRYLSRWSTSFLCFNVDFIHLETSVDLRP